MEPLARTIRSLVRQDVALRNASAAAVRLQDRRREREDVDAYLAQRLDVPASTGSKG